MSNLSQVIDQYLAGAEDVQTSFGDMSEEHARAVPVPGKWSALQLLCHLVDTDLMVANRIRAALASDRPRQLGLTTEQIMGMLAWESRNVQEEVMFFVTLRKQTARIVGSFAQDPSSRELVLVKPEGTETVKTVGQLLAGVTEHVPKHLVHAREKRERLGLAAKYAIRGIDL